MQCNLIKSFICFIKNNSKTHSNYDINWCTRTRRRNAINGWSSYWAGRRQENWRRIKTETSPFNYNLIKMSTNTCDWRARNSILHKYIDKHHIRTTNHWKSITKQTDTIPVFFSTTTRCSIFSQLKLIRNEYRSTLYLHLQSRIDCIRFFYSAFSTNQLVKDSRKKHVKKLK